jgi:hypothetical protein
LTIADIYSATFRCFACFGAFFVDSVTLLSSRLRTALVISFSSKNNQPGHVTIDLFNDFVALSTSETVIGYVTFSLFLY